MSQAELGNGRYSASYISHLESGRRHATEEVVTHLALRLGVSLDELVTADSSAYTAGSPGLALMVADSALREAQRIGDPELMQARAEVVVAEAVRARRADLWWQARRTQMQVHISRGGYTEAAEIGDELAGHPITRGSAELECEISAQLARCQRALGHLDRAFVLSSRACGLGPQVGPESYAEALIVHVAVIMDAGRVGEVADPVATLTALRDDLASDQLRGQVAWVLGNVAFLTGDPETGQLEHARATELVRPDHDLALWARFRQTSARVRLQAGMTEGVAELIDSAGLALTLVGRPADRANLDMVRAGYAHALGDEHECLRLCESTLAWDPPLSPQSRADVQVLKHQALLALGDRQGARDALRAGAGLYEEAGAWQRAALTWRTRAELEDEITSSAPRDQIVT